MSDMTNSNIHVYKRAKTRQAYGIPHALIALVMAASAVALVALISG